MNDNQVKKAVNGIGFSYETKKRIWEGFEKNQNDRRKTYLPKNSIRIAVAGILMFFIIVSALQSGPDGVTITVYAMDQEGNDENVLLVPGQNINLRLEETPVGYGYIFEVDIPDGYAYESVLGENSENIFAVYQKQNYIYWIPDGEVPGNIYNRDEEKLSSDEFERIETSNFEIVIYSDKKEVVQEIKLEFRRTDSGCVVSLNE